MRNFPDRWKPDRTNSESEAIAFRLGLMGHELRWALLMADVLVSAIKTAREQESVRTRLSALMALCVENEFGSPMRVNNRIVLATALKPSEKPEFKDAPVLVECLGGSFRFSEADAKAKGITVGVPRLLSRREVLELKLLVLVSEWAEKEGILERGWSSDPDLHIELGLRTTPRRKAKGDRKLEDLVQYRVDKTSDEKRILWIHKMESERTERLIPTPMYSMKVIERGGERYFVSTGIETKKFCLEEVKSLTGDFLGFENRATGRDEQDVDRESDFGTFHDHEGYAGVKPRRNPTRDENALLKRDRYRLDDSSVWLCRFTDGYERLQRSRKNKKGETFKVDWLLRSSFVPEGSKKEIKYWEKKFFPANCLQIVQMPVLTKDKGWIVDKVQVTDDREVAEVLGDPEIRGECKLAWKGGPYDIENDRVLPHPDVNVLEREFLGMLRGAIEERAFSHIALVPTKDYEVWEYYTDRLGKTRKRRVDVLKSKCFQCVRKWGKEGEAVRNWNREAHAWVCSVCGSERARVMGRVWVSVDLFDMLPIKERLTFARPVHGPLEVGQVSLGTVEVPAVTHLEFSIYGSWLGELINKGLKVDGIPRSSRAQVLMMKV